MSNDFDESSSNKETSKGLSWWYSTDVISQDKDDRASKRIRRMKLTDRLIRHPGRLSILYFSVLILLSTGLLTLPISTTNHDGFSNFPVSFFTAVSVLSTCGIPVVNTGEYWSMFGQVGHPVFHPVRWTWRDDLCFDSRIGWLFRRRGQRRQPSMPVHSCGRNDCRSRLP